MASLNYWLVIIHVFLATFMSFFFASDALGKDLHSYYEMDWSLLTTNEKVKPSSKEVCATPISSSKFEVNELIKIQDGQYLIDAAGIKGGFRDQIKLFGGVKIQQDKRFIFAPTVQLEMDSGIANFDEGFELTSPQFVLEGESARLEADKNVLRVNKPSMFFKDSGIRAQAQSVSQDANSDLVLSNALVTTCSSSQDSWSLTASRIMIDEDAKRGLARNLVLKLKGVPILYTPFLPIPMGSQQEGGFSFPSLGFSSEDGLELGIPYRFNWSDGISSLSLTPRLISKRGAGFKAVASFKEAWHQTEIGGGYLHRDRLFNGNLSREEYYRESREPELMPFYGVDRWSGRILHRGQLGVFETEVNHNFISDQDYFRDVSSSYSGLDRDALSQHARLGFSYDEFTVSVMARDFEIVDPVSRPGYKVQPEFTMQYQPKVLAILDLNLFYRSTQFRSSQAGLDSEGVDRAQRDHLEAIFTLPFRNRIGYAELETGYRHSRYNVKNRVDFHPTKSTSKLTRGVGFLSFDLGTTFEKEVTWSGRQFIHTLEPRVYYLFQEYEDQSAIPLFDTTRFFEGYSQLFRRDRFSGIDRIADANDLSIGVVSSLNNPRSGREIAKLRVGRTAQFRDRRVSLGNYEFNQGLDEAFSGDVSLTLNDWLRSVIGFVWDEKNGESNQSSFHLNYMGKKGEILNLGFRKLFKENVKQSDISLIWPLKNKASIFGKWSFDWNRNRTLDSFLGVQYDDCCLEVKFGYRKSLDIPASRYYALPQSDESILLQFNFKGFADFGSRVDSIMRQGIRGYADRK